MKIIYDLVEEDKEKLREPQGELVRGRELIETLKKRNYENLVCVGDKVSIDVSNSSIDADTYIVDGKIEREKIDRDKISRIKTARTFSTKNPKGTITQEAWRTVRKSAALNSSSKITVDGEEDLLALPAVLEEPSDSLIVYGLRNKGAVIMEAGKVKKMVENIVDPSKYDQMIVGGSWDILHSGHRYLLLTGFHQAEYLDIGVTSDQMLQRKLGEKAENDVEERKKRLNEFLQKFGLEDRARILEINDIYGNAVEEGSSLLVTPETSGNADKINQKRLEKSKDLLDVEVVEKLRAVDGRPISSTRIREGLIDEDGLER